MMQREFLRSKIHRATVTDADPDYEGSITVDRDLLDAAGIGVFEKVLVGDVDTGARFSTYTLSGEPGSGVVCVNGAAARLVSRGDKIIIMCFGLFEESEVDSHSPVIVHVDECNKVVL